MELESAMNNNDSLYRLFSDLPDFVMIEERNAIPPKEMEIKRGSDDIDIFHEAMKNVKRFVPDKLRVVKKTDKTLIHVQNTRNPKKLLEEALEDYHAFNVRNLPEYMEGYVEDINPFTMEKLRNGEFSIQKILDLHGYTEPEAYALFQDFIRESIKSGLNCVKIIHGRGLKSKDAPVLKEKLKTWIVRAMHRKWIAAFSSSKMCEGGPGAAYILLRDRPKKRRIHIVG